MTADDLDVCDWPVMSPSSAHFRPLSLAHTQLHFPSLITCSLSSCSWMAFFSQQSRLKAGTYFFVVVKLLLSFAGSNSFIGCLMFRHFFLSVCGGSVFCGRHIPTHVV